MSDEVSSAVGTDHRRPGERLLRTPSLSAAGGRPGRLPAGLGRSAPARRLPSLLAGRALSRRPEHTGGRLRHDPGRPVRAALAARPGHRHRRQRQEHRLHPRAEAQVRPRQSRGAPARRWSAPPNSAEASSTSSAPACCTICPTPTPACGPCATCSSRHGAINMMVYAPYGRAGRLHAAGLLPAARHRRDGGRGPRPRREPQGAAAGPSACATPAQLARLRGHGRAGRRVAPSPGPILLGPAAARRSSTGRGLAFGRWVRQAPYLPWCGALASTPHHARLAGTDRRSAIRRHRTVPRDDGPPQRRGLQEATDRREVRRSTSTARPGSTTCPSGCPIRSPFASGCRREQRRC